MRGKSGQYAAAIMQELFAHEKAFEGGILDGCYHFLAVGRDGRIAQTPNIGPAAFHG